MATRTAGKSISAWVDGDVAATVERAAALEGHTPAQFVAAATKFYLALPEQAHAAWRKAQVMGTPEEVNAALREVTRALLNAQINIAAARGREETERAAAVSGLDLENIDFVQVVEDVRKKRSSNG
jgi:hypothetical protein